MTGVGRNTNREFTGCDNNEGCKDGYVVAHYQTTSRDALSTAEDSRRGASMAKGGLTYNMSAASVTILVLNHRHSLRAKTTYCPFVLLLSRSSSSGSPSNSIVTLIL
ncbi:hypothetical protein Tco_0631431 [Tanacetum coccineum]